MNEVWKCIQQIVDNYKYLVDVLEINNNDISIKSNAKKKNHFYFSNLYVIFFEKRGTEIKKSKKIQLKKKKKKLCYEITIS